MMFGPDSLSSYAGLIAFCGAMIWAAIGDVRTFTITNKLNLTIAAGFLLMALPMGMSWPDIGAHLAVGGVTLVITITMFMLGVFGGGDAKMAGAVALWLGPSAMTSFILFTAFSGGGLVIVLILSRFLARKFGLPRRPKWARRLLRRQSAVPYGVAIGLGAILATPHAVWFPSL